MIDPNSDFVPKDQAAVSSTPPPSEPCSAAAPPALPAPDLASFGDKPCSETPLGGPWVWTKKRELAALLMSTTEDNLDIIAKKIDVNKQTLNAWKKHPAFQGRMQEHIDAWKASVLQRSIALRERRIESYLKDWEATDIVLHERGKQLGPLTGPVEAENTEEGSPISQPASAGCPAGEAKDPQSTEPYAGGARTGYITRDYKGQHAERPVYAFDAALFRERRALREQLARELGQWEADGLKLSGSLEVVKRIIGVDEDAV